MWQCSRLCLLSHVFISLCRTFREAVFFPMTWRHHSVWNYFHLCFWCVFLLSWTAVMVLSLHTRWKPCPLCSLLPRANEILFLFGGGHVRIPCDSTTCTACPQKKVAGGYPLPYSNMWGVGKCVKVESISSRVDKVVETILYCNDRSRNNWLSVSSIGLIPWSDVPQEACPFGTESPYWRWTSRGRLFFPLSVMSPIRLELLPPLFLVPTLLYCTEAIFLSLHKRWKPCPLRSLLPRATEIFILFGGRPPSPLIPLRALPASKKRWQADTTCLRVESQMHFR